MTTPLEIATERFLLRPLTEHDVNERYLAWMHDPDARKYITAAARTERLSDLKQYVRARVDREDVIFLGIFDRDNDLHIGNIKYEPVDSRLGYAVMGVLIGHAGYRGREVASEVIVASARWLHRYRSIEKIVLGVSKDNKAAIRAYERVGFIIAPTPYISVPMETALTMVLAL